MKCENCPACKSYFDGLENVPYCDIGVSEDEAYHDGDCVCNHCANSVECFDNCTGEADFSCFTCDYRKGESLC